MPFALVLAALLMQQPADVQTPEMAVLKAGLGPCSAEFTVTDSQKMPIYAAMIRVRVRYGLLGVKRADLEVGTTSAGKARIEGLPDKARPLTYELQKNDLKSVVMQNVSETCHATYDVTLEPAAK